MSDEIILKKLRMAWDLASDAVDAELELHPLAEEVDGVEAYIVLFERALERALEVVEESFERVVRPA